MRRPGHSVLEMLVALSVIGLISVGLGVSIFRGSTVLGRSTENAIAEQRILARQALRRLLAGALPPNQNGRQLSGNGDKVTFQTRLESDRTGARGIVLSENEIELIDGELILTINPVGKSASPQRLILAGEASGLEISYMYPEGTWLEKWSNRPFLPKAIRLSLDSAGNPDWPDFVVRFDFAR